MFLPLVDQGPNPFDVCLPARLQEGASDERGPAPESARDGRTNALNGLFVIQAYAPLAAARGAFGAGGSREVTGVDQTRCAGCGRRRDAAVAGPRSVFVGLMPAWTERTLTRALTPDGAFIPAGVDLRQDGAPEGIEFPGAGAPCAPQFCFDALDGLVGSDVGEKFGDRAAEGAFQQAFLLSRGKQVAIDFGH
jgi:hypothetical protein